MRVELNGEPVELPDGRDASPTPSRPRAPRRSARGVAAAVEGEVVPRADWDATARWPTASEVEVVRAVQGG